MGKYRIMKHATIPPLINPPWHSKLSVQAPRLRLGCNIGDSHFDWVNGKGSILICSSRLSTACVLSPMVISLLGRQKTAEAMVK